MQHEPLWLKEYLVAGVEDPRLNLQSILTRHFLVRALSGERYSQLMAEEYRFAAVMAWLLRWAKQGASPEDVETLRFGLRRGAENVEGLELPRFVRRCFNSLPADADALAVPNYVDDFLVSAKGTSGQEALQSAALDTFCAMWRQGLAGEPPSAGNPNAAPAGTAESESRTRVNPRRLTVIEPACGSANDYRYLDQFGLAPFLDYTGFDLCEKNVENARSLFPRVRFAVGNVFEIDAPDKSFDLCIVHDLFEHLSLQGMRVAAGEVCRVTRHGLCLGFFQMDEIREHVARPVEEYHWNLLSLNRMKELFASRGFAAQAVHIGTFLRDQVGCAQTHNPNAYTLLLRATG
jgi:hypothetical protein